MKLKEMNMEQLKQVEAQLSNTSRNGIDKYKRWEAEQKLKLVKAEIKKRSGVGGLLYRVQRMFEE